MYEAQWTAGVPTIAVNSQRDPYTDKLTEFKINIDMAGVNPVVIRRLQVMATFKYKLREILNLDMVGMLHSIVETPGGAGNVQMVGDLTFVQEEGILVDNVKRVLFDEDPILSDYSQLSLNEIVENY